MQAEMGQRLGIKQRSGEADAREEEIIKIQANAQGFERAEVWCRDRVERSGLENSSILRK
jgi:hypothetical protein